MDYGDEKDVILEASCLVLSWASQLSVMKWCRVVLIRTMQMAWLVADLSQEFFKPSRHIPKPQNIPMTSPYVCDFPMTSRRLPRDTSRHNVDIMEFGFNSTSLCSLNGQKWNKCQMLQITTTNQYRNNSSLGRRLLIKSSVSTDDIPPYNNKLQIFLTHYSNIL